MAPRRHGLMVIQIVLVALFVLVWPAHIISRNTRSATYNWIISRMFPYVKEDLRIKGNCGSWINSNDIQDYEVLQNESSDVDAIMVLLYKANTEDRCPKSCKVSFKHMVFISAKKRRMLSVDMYIYSNSHRRPVCPVRLVVSECGKIVDCFRPEEKGCTGMISTEFTGRAQDRFFVLKNGIEIKVFSRSDYANKNDMAVLHVWMMYTKLEGYLSSVRIYNIQKEIPHTTVVEASQGFGIAGQSIMLACSHMFGNVKLYNWTLRMDPIVGMLDTHGQSLILNQLDTTENGYYSCLFYDGTGKKHEAKAFQLSVFESELHDYEVTSIVLTDTDNYIRTILEMTPERWALKLYMEATITKYFNTETTNTKVSGLIEGFTLRSDSIELSYSYVKYGKARKRRTVKSTLQRYIQFTKWPDALFDAKNFLSGSVVTFHLEESLSMRRNKVNKELSMDVDFTKDNHLSLTCYFVSCVEHRTVFSVGWNFDGIPILTGENNTYINLKTHQQSRRKEVLCTTEVMQTTLEFKIQVTPRYYGRYECEMKISYSNRLLPWKVKTDLQINGKIMAQTKKINQNEVNIFPKFVHSLPGTRVSVYCRAPLADILSASLNDIWSGGKNVKNLGTWYNDQATFRKLTVIAPLFQNISRIVTCSWLLADERHDKSARIQLIEEQGDIGSNHRVCSRSIDRFGTVWPVTIPVKRVEIPCPVGYSGFAFRWCRQNKVWGTPSYLMCTNNAFKELSQKWSLISDGFIKPTSEIVESVSAEIASAVVVSKLRLSGDLVNIIGIVRDSAIILKKKTGIISPVLLENIATATNAVLSTDVKIWEHMREEQRCDNSSGNEYRDKDEGEVSGISLLVAMDTIMESSLKTFVTDNKPIVRDNIVIKREHLVKRVDIHFPDDKEKDLYEGHGERVTAHLPATAFSDHTGDIQYGVILYKQLPMRFSASGFVTKDQDLKDSKIVSSVLSFSINAEISSHLKLIFLTTTDKNSMPQCVRLDTNDNQNSSWSKKYCRTKMDAYKRVVCICNHLSNFAILAAPHQVVTEANVRALNVISKVGCIISIICLTMTLITYGFLWTYIQGLRTFLHVCLCVSLIMAYILILAGLDRTDLKIGCFLITASLHYVLLLAFTIMLYEGIELYLKVNDIYDTKFWDWATIYPIFLLPIFMVGVTASVTWNSGYKSPRVCWLNPKSGALWSFLTSILVVVLINVIICIQVIRKILSTQAMVNKESRDKAKAILKAVAVITPLLGFTWVLGLLALYLDAVVIHYLFAIFNSFQGLFIFILHCVMDQKVQIGAKVRFRVIKSRYEMSISGQ